MGNTVLFINYFEHFLACLDKQGMSRPEALKGSSLLTKNGIVYPKGVGGGGLDIVLQNACLTLDKNEYQMGLDFAFSMTSTSHGSIGLALLCCDTIRDAATTLCEYLPLISPIFRFHFYEDGDYIVMEDVTNDYISKSTYMFLVSCGVSCVFSYCFREYNVLNTGNVDTEHKPVIELRKDNPLITMPHGMDIPSLGIETHFESDRNCMRIPVEVADITLPTANSAARKSLIDLCDQELHANHSDFVDTVKRLVVDDDRFLSLEALAEMVCMSPRTLHRNLKAKGTSYSRIVADIRLEKAKRQLLYTDASIETIACALGYSEPTNFSSFFKKYQGQTPNQFRKSQQKLTEK